MTEYESKHDFVGRMINIVEARGITSQDLHPHVHKACVSGTTMPVLIEHETERAAKITSAGVAAQLHLLLPYLGKKKLQNLLESMRGPVDALVRGYTTTEQQRITDIGRYNVNETGRIRC